MKDSVHLIFGATGGIGSALARRLISRGARLVIAGRDEARLAEMAQTFGAIAVTALADDAASIEQAFRTAWGRHGRLDGVCNCFGSMLLKPAHLTSDEAWDETLRVNLFSCFAITRAVAKTMSDTGGSVVFFSSVAARVGLPNHEAIAAAKAGITGLALSAAATYAPKRIRFNVVAPGLTKTPLTVRITSNDSSRQASIRMHPLGRLGEADEPAAAAEWFLDPAQSWVTGQVLGVDGGLGSLRERM